MPAEATMQWQEGDEIGVFAEGNITHRNIPYSTNGAGYFSSTNPICYSTGSGSFNIIAYYPYTQELIGNTLPIDLTSNPHNILYSNNLKGMGAASKEMLNRLDFNHVLQRIYIRQRMADESMRSGNLEAYLEGYTYRHLSGRVGSHFTAARI